MNVMKIMMNIKPARIAVYAFLIFIVCICLFPIIYIILDSFKTNAEIMVGGVTLLPKVWHFDNYIRAWKLANFSKYTFNSLYMSFFIVLGAIATAVTEGYIFSRGTTGFSRVVYNMVLASLFISIGAMSLYPQFGLMKIFRLHNTLWGVIIIHVFGMNATQAFLATSFINQIPRELDEAARIDGCSFAKTYSSVIFPLTKPLIATIGLISFRDAWSDYLLPYVFTISRPMSMPLVVGVINLKTSGIAASSWDLALAGISISIIPMMIVYLILNRFFIAGLTEGAIKG
jgi:multiple sugar transport system permease protein